MEIEHAVENGGTLIVADTKSQVSRKACVAIEKYRKTKPGGKFILVIDEADAMFRTEGRSQHFEQALVRLEHMNPSMTVYISATPVSFMLGLLNRECGSRGANIDLIRLEPGDDYVGVEHGKPLQIGGKKVFLEQNELNLKTDIPYTTQKVLDLYDHALAASSKGILLLDCSCPRVYAEHNVFQKAAAVQKLYERKRKKIIVIAIYGKGIQIKYPNQQWKCPSKELLIGDILNSIDDDEDYGLNIPIFIFGFSKMRRGISFRSDKRVPTHMVMSLGRGHNISTVVQTLGRATFKFSLLKSTSTL